MISMKVEDRLEGPSNLISWNSKVLLLLEENDLLQFVNAEVPEREVEDAKPRWRKIMPKQEGFRWTQLETTWFLKSQKGDS